MSLHRTFVPLLVLTLISTAACWQVVGFIAEHELESRTGPCQAAMEQVKAELGKSRDMVHEEQGAPGESRVFIHEWHYPERADTVVVFRWEKHGTTCTVSREQVRR